MQKHNNSEDYTASKSSVSSSIQEKRIPSNIEAERAILSALLLHDDTVNRVSEFLAPDDFYSKQHKLIYQAILTISQAHKQVDIITLQDELTKKNELEVAGGLVYLISLQEDIPSLGLIDQHARIVKEKAILRSLINSAASIINNCYRQSDTEIDEVLDEAEKTIFQIANKRTSQSFVQIDIWLKKTFQHLSNIKSHKKGITGIPSGFRVLDQMTSGFQNGDLVILAARPSVGKTALALCIASHVARHNFTVGIFSLEMSAEQLVLRILSADSGVSHHNIRNATISSDEWIELTNSAANLAEKKIFIDDTAVLTSMELRTKVRKLKAEHNLQFLVIDYLQLIHTEKRYENRHQEISAISRSLKSLAKELNIPIIALSQLSRAVESRMDKRPMLSDLRESGAIEQDADLIMFLYRDIIYNADTQRPDQAELIIGKQRNGPTGTLNLLFVKELTKFEDYPQDYE